LPLLRNSTLTSTNEKDLFGRAVVAILIASIHEWLVVLIGRKAARSTEIPFEAATRAA